MGAGASVDLVEQIGKSSVAEIQDAVRELNQEDLSKLRDALKQCSEMSRSSEVKLKMLDAHGQSLYFDAKPEESLGIVKQRVANQLGFADSTSIRLLSSDILLDDSQYVAEVEGGELELVVISTSLQTRALPFLAVGRVKDATSLASYAIVDSLQYAGMDLDQTEQAFKKVLATSQHNLKPAQKIRLQWETGTLCCLMSENASLLCCVVTSSMKYPGKYAYQLLEELMQSVQQCGGHDEASENAMTDGLQETMRELLVKFDLGTFEQQDSSVHSSAVLEDGPAIQLKMLMADGKTIYCDAKPQERFYIVRQRLASQLGLANGASIKLLSGDTSLADSQHVAEVEGRELELVVIQGLQTRALPFLAVGRVKDATSLASHAVTAALENTSMNLYDTKDVFKKVLAASQQKLRPAQRTRLQWNAGSVCCLRSENGSLLCCVVTSSLEYRESFAYQLLDELMRAVEQLGGYDQASEDSMTCALQDTMRELLVKYEHPGTFQD